MIATLIRDSLCACGFPAIKFSIPLGTKYRVVVPVIQDCTFKCGGCGKEFKVKSILVERPGTKPGLLPLDILECEGLAESSV